MAYLIVTTQPLYWSVFSSGKVVISDISEVGGKIGIPPALTETHSTDPNVFLQANIGKTDAGYNPLPTVGNWCEAGKIYSYNGGLVICRQLHARTGFAPEDTPALFIVYRLGQGVLDWIAAERVEISTHRMYNSIEYVCLQAHVTQTDWTPPAVPALWTPYVVASPNWAAGVAYKVNDIVLYVPNGKTYKCRQAHTSQVDWTPPAVPALWQVQA